jgi:hypothetical protein
MPSDLARLTRPVWQSRAVPALSALLPPDVSPSGTALSSLLRQPGEEDSHLPRVAAPHGAPAPRGAQFPREELDATFKISWPVSVGDLGLQLLDLRRITGGRPRLLPTVDAILLHSATRRVRHHPHRGAIRRTTAVIDSGPSSAIASPTSRIGAHTTRSDKNLTLNGRPIE